jgi:uncharacterized protein (DUF934 family)
MPLLDQNGLRNDVYIRSVDGEAQPVSHALIPWVNLHIALSQRRNDQHIGTEVLNTLKASEIRPVQVQLSLIAISFPAFNDGRGFSVAKQLRNNGFSGIIRAVGPLIADQFAYALACGFDEIELPDAVAARQPVAHWLSALGAISSTYQRGYGHAGSILDQRRTARLAAAKRPA